jgi:hypothetical protein
VQYATVHSYADGPSIPSSGVEMLGSSSESLAVKPPASLRIHRSNVDSGDAPVMDPGDTTRGYPLDFGDTL